jgi:alpha-beta hydrolase superfamily lysophospholipase
MNQLEKLDHSFITKVLFHTRKDVKDEFDNPKNKMIPVGNNIEIGSRLHLFNKDFPNLIYFHGNAEIVSEYDKFAGIYNRMGINFIPVDYRGYGFSSGSPSFSTMISDSIKVFNELKSTLEIKGFRKPIFLMGRSLGSASVLEIVQNNQDKIGGIIIESGFAYIEPLFKLFGIDPVQLGINPENSINHIEKIKNYLGPLLVIHAKQDQIINFNEGVDLYQNASSIKKSNYWVENAHHNNIIQIMGMEYFQLIGKFI